ERFLPLPLQSGSDRVLRAMKRGYNLDLYRRRVAILREHVPDIELSSDWIVGFPGESDAEFEQSERALAEFGFAQSFVFRYSPRPSTAAADLEDDVPEARKAERNTRLLAASERAGRQRMERAIGSTHELLAEDASERRAGVLRGRTHCGLPVSFAAPAEALGSYVRVRIESASPYGLSGARVDVAADELGAAAHELGAAAHGLDAARAVLEHERDGQRHEHEPAEHAGRPGDAGADRARG
ncbi:MAG: radical SAM protein, partial [Planctomycetota bacterium]